MIASIVLRFSKAARRVHKETVKLMLGPDEYERLIAQINENMTCKVIVTWTRGGFLIKGVKLSDELGWRSVYYLS